MDNEIGEARVGSSRHAAWVLHVIRFDLDALLPRNRRAITIGGAVAPPTWNSGGPWTSGPRTRRHGGFVYQTPHPGTRGGGRPRHARARPGFRGPKNLSAGQSSCLQFCLGCLGGQQKTSDTTSPYGNRMTSDTAFVYFFSSPKTPEICTSGSRRPSTCQRPRTDSPRLV